MHGPPSNIRDQIFAWHHVRKNLDPWRVRNYKYSRGINGDDVTRILFEEVVLNKNPARALDRILQLSALRKYYNMLESEKEKNDFRRHAAKYINIWLPDCAFEISFTNRYMVDQWEGKTTARKFVKAGEKIKYLCGELVQISLGEEDDDRFIENAFSITYSSRRKTPSLFLGPARFSNHDCNANAKLESRGNEGMCVIAVRDIEVGDEINVHYGDNYFGEDNCECLCASCEKYGRGAWQHAAEADGLRTPRAGSVEEDDPGSRRSKRKRNIVDYKQRCREVNTRTDGESPTKRTKTDTEYNGRAKDWTPTPGTKELHTKLYSKIGGEPIAKTSIKPAQARTTAMLALVGRPRMEDLSPAAIKSEYENSPHRSRWGFSATPNSEKRLKSAQGRRRHSTSSPTKKSSKGMPYKSQMLFTFLRQASSKDEHKYKLQMSPFPMSNIPSVENEMEHSQESAASSEEASVFDIDHIDGRSVSSITEPHSYEDGAIETEHIKSGAADSFDEHQIVAPSDRRPPSLSLKGKLVKPSALEKVSALKKRLDPPEDEDIVPSSALRAIEDSPDPVQPIAVTELMTTSHTNPIANCSKHPTSTSDSDDPPVSPTPSTAKTAHRIPGDYIRTPRLLGPRNSRWVECRTCDDVFIQLDAHQTRRECPRCERHSKLYGFQWPQTDYERNGGEGTGPRRVMDHRTVNRFLSRAEEMEVSRKGRGCVTGSGKRIESTALETAVVHR